MPTRLPYWLNPSTPARQTIETEARIAAQVLGVRVELLVASTEAGIDAAFATAIQRGVGALLVGGDAYFNSRRATQFIAFAARHGLPANSQIGRLRAFENLSPVDADLSIHIEVVHPIAH